MDRRQKSLYSHQKEWENKLISKQDYTTQHASAGGFMWPGIDVAADLDTFKA
jgi:hypothetical protein